MNSFILAPVIRCVELPPIVTVLLESYVSVLLFFTNNSRVPEIVSFKLPLILIVLLLSYNSVFNFISNNLVLLYVISTSPVINSVYEPLIIKSLLFLYVSLDIPVTILFNVPPTSCYYISTYCICYTTINSFYYISC